MKKTTVLNSERIRRIITRIAHQSIEACNGEGTLVVVGIQPRGPWVARQIAAAIEEMSDIQCEIIEYKSDDTLEDQRLENKRVLLVDDIVNSGTTMMRAAGAIAQCGAGHVMTACLVDRMHRMFPISMDFTGLSLATTLQEHLKLMLGRHPTIILE